MYSQSLKQNPQNKTTGRVTVEIRLSVKKKCFRLTNSHLDTEYPEEGKTSSVIEMKNFEVKGMNRKEILPLNVLLLQSNLATSSMSCGELRRARFISSLSSPCSYKIEQVKYV